MQDPYYDLKRDMNVSAKAQWPTMQKHVSGQSRISAVGPKSSDVYYNDMSGAFRSEIIKQKQVTLILMATGTKHQCLDFKFQEIEKM